MNQRVEGQVGADTPPPGVPAGLVITSTIDAPGGGGSHDHVDRRGAAEFAIYHPDVAIDVRAAFLMVSALGAIGTQKMSFVFLSVLDAVTIHGRWLLLPPN